ncbi:DUF3180 family protein [Microbacterium album]|uniref:DUF3180 domain-containing protein n=1 Tax=Microbacterium album TaxID=2053191 RepID=A0A917MM55_9MICO|nr:DUF3180 family protein [Microbacterium album]GGH45080.1 hypothetical protein GCM10010921_20220 [Microbacterium album]
MRRTSALALLVAAVLGGGAGFLIDQVLTSAGRPTFTPVIGLPVLLVALGALCLAVAWPVRRSTRPAAPGRPAAPRVDPFRALTVVVLAKASSLVGAGVGGAAVGMLLFVATRPVVPALGSMTTLFATAAAGALLVVAALVAEHFCTLPKGPGTGDEGSAGAGSPDTGRSHDPDDREPDDA